MSHYEYRVVPAPREIPRVKGLRGTEERFAYGLSAVLNDEARDGWEFVRMEVMTAEIRRGFLGGKRSETTTLLVFRRWAEGIAANPPTARQTEAQRPDKAAPRIGAVRRPDIGLRTVPAPNREER
ncbi:uncharacterized protein DUF4177 [Palleronia aestuarii]|uniref:Uncharacterized protein DUF4177 n=1 Tax=Palleronia aestuarii TaxID=568105 RepID=A0A2W7N834_9RHOB|nr:DUF4177 domain-containing protein [Palleronia aestuarii]PZX16238.1 uncharacterized protein DUF4177 [Palleronia aestuarii]